MLSLPGPVFEHRGQLAANAEWATDAFRYRVQGSREVDGVMCWEVEAVSTGQGGGRIYASGHGTWWPGTTRA